MCAGIAFAFTSRKVNQLSSGNQAGGEALEGGAEGILGAADGKIGFQGIFQKGFTGVKGTPSAKLGYFSTRDLCLYPPHSCLSYPLLTMSAYSSAFVVEEYDLAFYASSCRKGSNFVLN